MLPNRRERRALGHRPARSRPPITEVNAFAVELVSIARTRLAGDLDEEAYGAHVGAVLADLQARGGRESVAWLVRTLADLPAILLAQWEHDHPLDEPARYLQALALASALGLPDKEG